MILNRYQENAVCSKCGSERVQAFYHSEFNLIRRECVTCEHHWAEVPLDHPAVVQEVPVPETADTGTAGAAGKPGA